MAKSKDQKRKEAIERAKEHFLKYALPDFLKFYNPILEVLIEDNVTLALSSINRRLAILIRQANLAKVDLDGFDVEGVVDQITFDDIKEFSKFYTLLLHGYKRRMKSNEVVTHLGSHYKKYFNHVKHRYT